MRKNTASLIITLALSVALGLFFAVNASDPINRLLDPAIILPIRILNLAGMFFCLVASVFAQFIFHESGHLVFGLLSGYRFASFRVGSLVLLRQNSTLKLKRFSLAGTGGQCLMIPPDIRDDHFPFLLYLLGGSLMNLLTVPIFWGLHIGAQSQPMLSVLCLMLTFMGAFIALTNGIPMSTDLVDNDGVLAISFAKKPEAKRCFWLLLKINELNASGMRLKEMPGDWFIMPAGESLANPLCAAAGVLSCSRAIDSQDFAEARQIADYLLEHASGLSGLNRSVLSAERVFCELIGPNRQEISQPQLTKADKQYLKAMARYPGVIRQQYATALLSEHNAAKADKWLSEFEKVAKNYPYPAEIEGERELLAIVDALAAKTPDLEPKPAQK